MPFNSHSRTQELFIITSRSFQSVLSAVQIKKLKWVCASWVLQSMKICLYAHIRRGCQDWHFKKLLRGAVRRDPLAPADEFTCVRTRPNIFSFLFRAPRYLSAHWHHFFFSPSNILTTFIEAARLSCHSPSGKSVNTNMKICANKIWHYHRRMLWKTA